jgi:heat shock protein HslJ
MGCPAGLEAQEQALASLFFARPLISSPVPGRVRFEGGGHSLELERSGPAASVEEPAAPAELADTAWRITSMDGQEDSSTPTGRVLRFGRDDWRGLASCATLFGTWRRQGDRILAGRDTAGTEQNCRPDHARIDDSFADLMRSNPRYLIGPNGELLLAGAGHSLTGQRLVRPD